jgi:hypothetical protein
MSFRCSLQQETLGINIIDTKSKTPKTMGELTTPKSPHDSCQQTCES